MRTADLTWLLGLALTALTAACDAAPDRERLTVSRPPSLTSATPFGSDADVPDTTLADTDLSDSDEVQDVHDVVNLPDSDEVQDVHDIQDLPDSDTTDSAQPDTSTPDTTDTAQPDTTTPDTTPDTATPPLGAPCQVGLVTGTCRHVADCADDEAAIEGFCEGHPQVRCCIPAWDRCSSASRPGACIATTDCPGPDWATSSGLCPGPAEIRCCTGSAPAPTCDPNVRPAPNAALDPLEEPGDPGCPPGMALITSPSASPPGFCIDRFEASLVLDSSPGAIPVHHSPYHNPGSTPVRAVSLRYAVPQGYIDQVRAKAACERANKRLCTSTEWLFACQGASQNTYPYGPTRQPGVCNDDRRQHVALELFPNDPNPFSKIGNACLSQLPNSVDLTGENAGCVTPSGVFDLMGNVHEWIDDPAGTFRGGFFDDTTINGNGCLYRTTAHDVNHWDYSTGFRCCADF